MQERCPVFTVPAAVLARKMLDLWTRQDREGLLTELRNVLVQTRFVLSRNDAYVATGEWERQELIGAIAERLQTEPAPWNASAEEPRFGVWASLLRHLSAGDSSAAGYATVN